MFSNVLTTEGGCVMREPDWLTRFAADLFSTLRFSPLLSRWITSSGERGRWLWVHGITSYGVERPAKNATHGILV